MLQALNAAPTRAATLTASLPREAYPWQPGPGEWSMHQLIAHLTAAEAPFLKRLTRIIEEESPWLPYFGPDVARPDSTAAISALLEQFRAARDQLLRFLSDLPPEAWNRPATHETLGPTTLALQVQNIVNHDADHLGQLKDLRQAWEGQAHQPFLTMTST